MNRQTWLCYREKSMAKLQVGIGMFFSIVGGAAIPFRMEHASRFENLRFEWYEALFYGIFIVGGLLLVGFGISHLLDNSVKLTIDDDGIIDHRAQCGELRTRWEEFASFDCQLGPTMLDGMLVVYLQSTDGSVSTRYMNIGWLEAPPGAIFTEIKTRLLALSGSLPPLPPQTEITR